MCYYLSKGPAMVYQPLRKLIRKQKDITPGYLNVRYPTLTKIISESRETSTQYMQNFLKGPWATSLTRKTICTSNMKLFLISYFKSHKKVNSHLFQDFYNL